MNITTENIFDKTTKADFKELLDIANSLQPIPVADLYDDYLRVILHWRR